VYSANNASVTYTQGVNPTFLRPNGASNFTFTVQYTNSCGTFFRSVPLIARSAARLAFYPNPTTDNLTVKSETGDWIENLPTEIRVYDERQNLVYQQETLKTQQDNDYSINLNNQTKDKYFVHILFSDGSIHK
jgi:Secretion system C-terminal sorting domain